LFITGKSFFLREEKLLQDSTINFVKLPTNLLP
jgi:hypothetical protein